MYEPKPFTIDGANTILQFQSSVFAQISSAHFGGKLGHGANVINSIH